MARRSKPVDEAPETPEADRRGDLPHPRGTLSLFGHDGAERTILETLRTGKLPHAWLIGGPEGIGKATLAYRFARAMLAHGNGPGLPASLEVDAEHPAARRIASGAHPDLVVLRRPYDATKKRLMTVLPVDEVRRLQNSFAHHAGDGGWRVAIIDSVDDMNRNAANALLKVLEEPPPRALLLLVAHAPARLLPTIRSRCRRLTLNPLGEDALGRVFEAQDVRLDPEDRNAIVRLADGSAGRALDLAKGDGLALYRTLVHLLGRLPAVDAPALHGFADKVGGRGREAAFETMSALMEVWFARLIRASATDRAPADVIEGDGAQIHALAASRPLDAWTGAWDKIAASFAQGTALNLDRKQLVLTAFFTLQAAARG